MTKHWIPWLGILAIASLAVPAGAQAPGHEATTHLGSFTGEVQSYSDNQLVVASKDGEMMTFRVDDPTKVPESIHEGQNVRIDWKDTDGGARVAVMVKLLDEPSDSAAVGTSASPGTAADLDDDGDGDDDGSGNATASAARPTPAAQPERTRSSELPHTAGPVVLLLVSGITAVAGGLGLKELRS